MISFLIFLSGFGIDSPYCQLLLLAEGVDCGTLDYYLSTYDPKLGGINCDSDCSQLATGPMDDSLYGLVAACPHDWVGYEYTTHISTPYGTFACVDRGGAIGIYEREVWMGGRIQTRMVIVIDLLIRIDEQPLYAYSVLSHELVETFGGVNPLREGRNDAFGQ